MQYRIQHLFLFDSCTLHAFHWILKDKMPSKCILSSLVHYTVYSWSSMLSFMSQSWPQLHFQVKGSLHTSLLIKRQRHNICSVYRLGNSCWFLYIGQVSYPTSFIYRPVQLQYPMVSDYSLLELGKPNYHNYLDAFENSTFALQIT